MSCDERYSRLQYWVAPRLYKRDRMSLAVGGQHESHLFELGEYIIISIKLQEIHIKYPLPIFNRSLPWAILATPKHEKIVLHG